MARNLQKSTQSTENLEPSQVTVITALVRGASVLDATRQAHVDRTTFYLWRKSDPVFQAELARAKQERTDVMRAQLGELAETAVSVIRDLLTDRTCPAAVRLKAAIAVLQSIDTLSPEAAGATDPDRIRAKAWNDELTGLLG